MEYILIIILQLIGIGLHVMQKVSAINDKYPEKSHKEVFVLFWQEDFNTVVISALVLALNLTGHYIIEHYTDIASKAYFHLWNFGTALVLGYAGQRIIYKYLGTAERFLDKKVENKLS